MTAQIFQIRDYQSKKDRERMQAELERQAVQIANEAFPSVFGLSAGIDDLYTAPEKDPA